MANKKFWLGILVMTLVFGMSLINCDDGTNDIPDITYTAVADDDTETTTKINFVFSAGVKLTAENITVTAGTGSASKGTLTGSGTNWSLNITVATAGTVKVKIAKDGIESGEKTVMVHKTTTTYTVTPNGTADTETTTRLTFAFSAAVSGLTAGDITITDDTGSASKETLTGSGTNWSLNITVATAGTVKVKIAKTGIESIEKTVTVHKAADTSSTITYTVTANGASLTETTTQLDFTFSEAVSVLTAEDITITAGTGSASKGTLTGSGTNWSLSITVASAGTVKVKIAKNGIESDEKTVTIHKAVDIPTGNTYTVTANGTADTETTTQLVFAFSAAASGLTAEDITITAGTGAASKGTLTGSGTSWNLSITDVSAGTVKVKIAKTGIENGEKTVTIYKADGSSSARAIPLSIAQWEDGSVTAGNAKWYKFEAASGTSYRVQWKDKNDKPDSDSYTAWVKVTAYQSDGTTNISTVNGVTSGWTSPKTISGVSGTVYLKVEPYSDYAGYAGTYTIRFYDPAIIVPQIPMTISSASATPVPTVVVTWNSSLSTSGISGYRVYRSSAETGTYTQIGSDITSYSTIRYTDTDVSAGNTYWYKVAAYNSVGEGDKSVTKQSDIVPSTSVGTSLTIGADLTEGTISTATQVNWYTFTAVSGTTYKVQWENYFDSSTGSLSNSTYTGVVKVSAFNSSGAPITTIQSSTLGWTSPKTISGVSGTVYIKVEVYIGSINGNPYTGTYGIKVYQQ